MYLLVIENSHSHAHFPSFNITSEWTEFPEEVANIFSDAAKRECDLLPGALFLSSSPWECKVYPGRLNAAALIRWLRQVSQKSGGVKNKTEKRQADQRQRESLKRRKSLPRQAEPSAVNPEKSMSAPASQVPTTTDIPMSSGSAVTTSSTSKSTVSEENVSSASTASQEIQGAPRLETVQV